MRLRGEFRLTGVKDLAYLSTPLHKANPATAAGVGLGPRQGALFYWLQVCSLLDVKIDPSRVP